MVVVRITSLLANQMFAYASIKTIAKDKGYEFHYVHEHCLASESSNSSVDKKFGKDFDTIFPITKEEELISFNSSGFIQHEEYNYIKKYDSFYYEEATQIKDNTYMLGHFICPKYFIHRIDEVRKWFTFPKEIDRKASDILDRLKKANTDCKIVAVHFRVGQDYLLHGFLMDSSYWIKAGEKMLTKYGKVKFAVFCDKRTNIVEKFINRFDSEVIRGTLVEDMCCMTKCDAHILSNSTFSMMGALLNPCEDLYVIRPSHYFTGSHSEQKNCFLDSWDIVESRRNLKSFVLSTFKMGGIRNRIYDLFHK